MVVGVSKVAASSLLVAGVLLTGAEGLRQQQRTAFLGLPHGAGRQYQRYAPSHGSHVTRWSTTETKEPEAQPMQMKQERTGISEDDPLVQRLRENILKETGVELDQLLNPSKVVNLEFDLINLRNELDVTPDGAAKDKIEKLIAKKEATLAQEKRLVMRGWLKNLFLSQSLLAIAVSGVVAYDALPGFDNLPLPIRAFAFWSFWMFTIPSLRARKPGQTEKKALDIAFLVTPVVSLGMPFLTQDVPTIWWANAIATGASYGYAYTFQSGKGEDEDDDETLPAPLKAALKALDWGSGRERGTRRRDGPAQEEGSEQ